MSVNRVLAIVSLLLVVAVPLFCRWRCRAGDSDLPRGRALHIIFLITLALMTLSSILMLAIGRSMRGWMLMLHMSVAPLFAIAIALLALLWAQRTSALLRLVLLSAFVTILTAMLTMMSWFGSDAQRCLLEVHRVGSMVLLVAAAAQAGRLLFPKHAARTGD